MQLTDKIPFFISFFERSGSTFLSDLLNNHPEISCKKEIFAIKKDGENHIRLPRFSDRESVKMELETTYNSERKANGFKFKYPLQYQYYSDVYEYLLTNRDNIRVIFLYRRNRLKAAISQQNHRRLIQLGNKSNLKQQNYVDLGKLHLNIKQACNYINKREELDRKYYEELKHFSKTCVIAYEDLYNKTKEMFADLCLFLDVNSSYEPKSKQVKVTKDNLEEAIDNYEEIFEKLRCTRYEPYLLMS